MKEDPKFAEIEKEIDNMNLEELLYIKMAPHTYLNKKIENELKNSNEIIKEIESNANEMKRNEEQINNQKAMILNECNQLKMEIEQSKRRIEKLIDEKKQLTVQPKKEDFINALDNEIRNKFKTPDNYFRDFLAKKITQSEFCENLRNCGIGKNYYYYKIISDKLKEM